MHASITAHADELTNAIHKNVYLKIYGSTEPGGETPL